MRTLRDVLFSKWVACSLISDKRSVEYGVRFSYPVYILIVLAGILLRNPYTLLITAFIAFLGIKLPLHPFDYIYNWGIAQLFGISKIPGRGSELQVNSAVAMLFSLIAVALLALEVSINYGVLAIIYALFSVYFIGVFLFRG
ncbi:MAG: DUF4395 family protein [Candidatus Doudnabacteria bacterium]|nr:DUF4395 family protein [Candidatus Doudnabacteria bacterium]